MTSAIINYDEPVFRPPSEAGSLIIQATIGCSNNRCTFCEMYTTKLFRTRSIEDISADLKTAAQIWPNPAKIFLADGDALVLSTKRLVEICGVISQTFRNKPRISAYASPQNLAAKTLEELKAIREAGISLIYYGVESGCDEVLKRVRKGATAEELGSGLIKASKTGLDTSVTWILGLGGKRFSHDHALDTATLLSKCGPTYTSALTLMLPCGEGRLKKDFPEWEEISPVESLMELKLFAQNYKGPTTIFRSNHASNYLPLKANLPNDKDALIAIIDEAIQNPEETLKPEWLRAL